MICRLMQGVYSHQTARMSANSFTLATLTQYTYILHRAYTGYVRYSLSSINDHPLEVIESLGWFDLTVPGNRLVWIRHTVTRGDF